MSDVREVFRLLLKDNGYSLTKQRTLVFTLLLDSEPQSMRELIQNVAGRIDTVSVYRTIALFEKLNIVQRLNMGWKYKYELTDKFDSHHHHLSCKNCGSIVEINEDALEAFIQHVALQNEFSATEHQVELQGYCKNCVKQPDTLINA